MIGKYFAAAVIAAACVLSGCASVTRASGDSDVQAKQFAPVADKAVVYVYRDELLGAGVKMTVTVDGVLAGETGPKSFLQLGLAPGKHTIQSVTEKNVSVDIDTQAGQNYYVWQEVKMGLMAARSALHVVDAAKAKADIADCHLIVAAPSMRVAPGNVVSPEPVVPAAPTPVTEARPIPAAVAVANPVAPTAPAATAATVTEPSPPSVVTSMAPASGGLAVRDDRVGKPMFVAAQDIASRHQCERAIRVRSVDGDDAHFYSQCPGTSTPIEIVCNGANCHEGAPQG